VTIVPALGFEAMTLPDGTTLLDPVLTEPSASPVPAMVEVAVA